MWSNKRFSQNQRLTKPAYQSLLKQYLIMSVGVNAFYEVISFFDVTQKPLRAGRFSELVNAVAEFVEKRLCAFVDRSDALTQHGCGLTLQVKPVIPQSTCPPKIQIYYCHICTRWWPLAHFDDCSCCYGMFCVNCRECCANCWQTYCLDCYEDHPCNRHEG